MELVTKDNIDYYKKVKLTDSGIKLHYDMIIPKGKELKDMEFFIPEVSSYNPQTEGWCGLYRADDPEKREHWGVRIGEDRSFDIYYPLCYDYDIEAIEKNLDYLSYKLEVKFFHDLTK